MTFHIYYVRNEKVTKFKPAGDQLQKFLLPHHRRYRLLGTFRNLISKLTYFQMKFNFL